MAFVSIRAYDDDLISPPDFIGQCTVPLLSVRQGFGHVHLRTLADNVMDQVTLFVHATLE